MENVPNYTPEELNRLLEKAQREAQAALDRLSPEERAQAERRVKEMIEADAKERQKLIDEAAAVAAGAQPAKAPRFCASCGAPAGSGKFCAYCGSPLEREQ